MAALISPETIEVRAGETFTLDIVIQPQGRKISAGEVVISFQPEIFQVLDVQAGNLMGSEPVTAGRVLDNEEGIVSLAVARVGPIPVTEAPLYEGVLATIQWQVAEDVPPIPVFIALDFIGLADENFNEIPNISLGSGTVTIVLE